MHFSIIYLLAVSAVAAQSNVVAPFGQCGGLFYTGAWQCTSGTTCKPINTDAFPDYECLPNVGPASPHVLPYAQCGGEGFTGSTLCSPGWVCTVTNPYNSQCLQDTTYIQPVNNTPNLADPGAACASTAILQGMPATCVPGWTCSGPGIFGYYVCLRASTTTVVTTTSVTPTTTAKPW